MLIRRLVPRALIPIAFVLTAVPGAAGAAAEDRVSEASLPSLERFSEVDTRLWRGSQPDEAEFATLRDLGVRTVINLRNDDSERQAVEALGMRYVAIPLTMHAFGRSGPVPEDAVQRFFEVVDDPANGLVFVHCRRGADRTGTFVALYRIARQHWTPQAAYQEAREIGMRWWHYPVKAQLQGLGARFAPASAAPALAEETAQ